jgi:hypothetical protein
MHKLAVSLHFGVYNYVRRHHTLGTTPAVAAGLEEKAWSLEHVVEMTVGYFDRKNANAEAVTAIGSLKDQLTPTPNFYTAILLHNLRPGDQTQLVRLHDVGMNRDDAHGESISPALGRRNQAFIQIVTVAFGVFALV